MTEGTNRAHGLAVIGSGIAGLTAAYLLRNSHPVTLFEADDRLGGHAHTHPVRSPDGGRIGLDSGFIVHNERAYPYLVRLFHALGVRTQASDMSLSVSCRGCGLGYVGGGLRALPQRVPGVSPAVWAALLRDLSRFGAHARQILDSGDPVGPPLGEVLAGGAYDEYFVAHVVLPLVCAVWSCGPGLARAYPAGHLLRFFDRHGLLGDSPATRWRTVAGGSQQYVAAIAAQIPQVLTSTPARMVRRLPDGVEVCDATGSVRHFDRVVIAVHPDQALRLLADPTHAERDILGAIPYIRNDVVLHTDTSVLPTDRRNWASWNLTQPSCSSSAEGVPGVHYHLNRLQRIEGPTDYVVSVQAVDAVDPGAVLARMVYEHPAYTVPAASARDRLADLNSGRTVYAGAYQGWGFHEDGCRSGVQAARAFGVSW